MDTTVKPAGAAIHWSDRLRARSKGGDGSAAKDENQRFARRKPTDIGGYILTDKLSTQPRCVVRDTSSSGARVHLLPSPERVTVDDLPEHFRLVMLYARERTEVQCVVVRKTGDSAGVRFTSSFKTTALAGRSQLISARSQRAKVTKIVLD